MNSYSEKVWEGELQLSSAFLDNDLVKGLNRDEIEALAALAEVKQYRAGDAIAVAGEIGHDLMILLSGSVMINSDLDVVIATLGPGSVVGELSLIDNEPRSATVESIGESSAAVIPSDKLYALMEQRPNIAFHVYKNLCVVLCRRLRNAKVQIDGLMAR